MKKKTTLYSSDEIDLFNIIKIIWFDRIKIFIITIISLLMGLGYFYLTPKSYLNSLTISPSDNSEFVIINSINELIRSNKFNQITYYQQSDKTDNIKNFEAPYDINEKILARFINELVDYEEFLVVLKNLKNKEENFKNLSALDKKKKLFEYVKLLEIVKPKKKERDYILNFKWNDIDEAKNILQDTFNRTISNLKLSVYDELILSLETQRKIILNQDRNKLNYLIEQSSIAKELNIVYNQIENTNSSQSSSVSLNVNTADVAYYLRGSKAIDKEIELIQNRNYQSLKLIEQDISLLKEKKIRWVIHNINLIEIKPLKNFKLMILISILLGLIFGVFYVLVSYVFQSKTVLKKN